MANRFHTFSELRDRVADRSFDRPPAVVCNAHITGLAVSRALAAHSVPVIALDRDGKGVAPYSDAVELAGKVTYPLDDEEGFRADVEAIADATDHEPVVFPCMDEWVHALARTEPEGVRLPFADFEHIDAVLDKSSLYERAAELGVPIPETYRLDETDPEDAADALGFPLIVKPALKREFEEAFGTNVVEVETPEEYHDVLEAARAEDILVLAQEKVQKKRGADSSLASYVPESGVADAVTFVGNARVRYPLGFGTSCVVRRADAPEVESRALSVIEETGYYGISESEFVYDERREEYVLLDINTRPWKWVGLPVQAGANLPVAAYADAVESHSTGSETSSHAPVGEAFETGEVRDATWVYLADYLSLLAGDDGFTDVLGETQWLSLLSGAFETDDALTTGVYAPSDPDPLYRLLRTEFGGQEYYCSC